MQIKLKQLSQSMVEIEIKTTEEQWQNASKIALQKLSQQVKVDGFRKGHAPEKILIEKIGGEHAFEHQILDVLLPKTYAEAVKKENLQVIAHPEIEIIEHKPLIYKAKVAVYPEVELPDYKKVKIEKKDQKVAEKEINEWMEKFQKQVAETQEVKRAAKKGDHAEVDFEGFNLDGVSLENTKSKNHPVVLGENTLIPGFEEEILGMEVGTEKEFKIRFPKDYHAKSFANQEVKFKVKLNRLSELVLPEINPEFVQKITGEKKSVAEFKKEIEESLLEKKNKEEQARRENDWLTEVAKKIKLEIPQILIEEEVDFMIDEIKMQGLQQGVPWEGYLKHLNKTEEELRKEFAKTAEQRVKLRMVAQAVVKAEKIEITEAEVQQKAKQIIDSQPANYKAKYQEHYQVGGKGFVQLKNQMIFEKLFAIVLN